MTITAKLASALAVLLASNLASCGAAGSDLQDEARVPSPVPSSHPVTSNRPADTTTASSSPSPPGSAASTARASSVVTLLVIGDFGSGSPQEQRVASAMEEVAATRADALVTTGDNLYSNDVAASWREPFGWVAAEDIPVFAAWGNHDVESAARRAAVQEALDPPGRWYLERIGPATLIVLDGNRPADPDQLAWLRSVLSPPPPGPLLISFHQPAHSCGPHGSTPQVISQWVPLFEAAGVDLVLNGHDHNYQRFRAGGVNYIVTGGGGQGLYEVGRCRSPTPDPVAVDDTHHHFLVLEVTAGSIHGQAISVDRVAIDTFSIRTVTSRSHHGDHHHAGHRRLHHDSGRVGVKSD